MKASTRAFVDEIKEKMQQQKDNGPIVKNVDDLWPNSGHIEINGNILELMPEYRVKKEVKLPYFRAINDMSKYQLKSTLKPWGAVSEEQKIIKKDNNLKTSKEKRRQKYLTNKLKNGKNKTDANSVI